MKRKNNDNLYISDGLIDDQQHANLENSFFVHPVDPKLYTDSWFVLINFHHYVCVCVCVCV